MEKSQTRTRSAQNRDTIGRLKNKRKEIKSLSIKSSHHFIFWPIRAVGLVFSLLKLKLISETNIVRNQ